MRTIPVSNLTAAAELATMAITGPRRTTDGWTVTTRDLDTGEETAFTHGTEAKAALAIVAQRDLFATTLVLADLTTRERIAVSKACKAGLERNTDPVMRLMSALPVALGEVSFCE